MIQINIASLNSELKQGLILLCEDYDFALSDTEGLQLFAEHTGENLVQVSLKGQSAVIRYHQKSHFFRGFSLLLEHLKESSADYAAAETPQFDELGAMFDVSQGNAVLRVSSVKAMLRRMAMMGMNMLMLYCEDSYTVEEEPYFGYMRGRYTEAELKECDDYAYLLGIEMIPCIQTLSHLIDVLKWPAFDNIKEDYETLFVGGDETYAFIEHLIRAAVKPFRTKRIHIGMDEAWHLGTGRYLAEHGLVPGERIMQEHLSRVMEIVRKLGLQPMMWSDMFLRQFGGGDYYKEQLDIPKDAASLVPPDIDMVYWDYYHEDEAFYDSRIQTHRLFGEPIFAGGVWTWVGFGANWGLTYATTHPALQSCKKNGIRRVFATIWGDNGTECNIWANLPGLQLFAEHGYAESFDEEKFRRRFAFCCGAVYEDFDDLRYLDEIPGCKPGNLEQVNASKYLLWQDPLMGLFDYHVKGLPLREHYQSLTSHFEKAMTRNGAYNEMFRFYMLLSKTLAAKAELGLCLTQAYHAGDREALKTLAAEAIPQAIEYAEQLRRCHKANWFIDNKAMGWDIMDMRYGSLLIRLRSAKEQVEAYLNGDENSLEELAEPRRSFNGKEGLVPYANWYGRIVSASRIAPEA